MRLRPHGRFGLYELEALVSEGGLGEVWKAHHTTSGRLVALRIVPSPPRGDPFRFAHFEHDVSKLTSLRHVNIAKAYELLEVDSVRALVFEWVTGESLASRLVSGPIPIDEALQVIAQVAKGLAAAHARDLVHGDLKPSNVAICPNGSVKILDLGLIEIYEPGATAAQPGQALAPRAHSARLLGAITGTAGYFSPEQILGRAADSRSDVWAFGCVLYEILTGKPAFAADDFTETMALVNDAEPEWTLILPTTPPPLVDVLRRCLKKDATQRFHRMTDVLAQLRATTGEEVPQVAMKSVLESALEQIRGQRILAGAQLEQPSPLEEAIHHEPFARYRAALEELDEPDRALIESRIERLETYDEIASHLSFASADAARIAVTRAMRRLLDRFLRTEKDG